MHRYAGLRAARIAGIEARGFTLGGRKTLEALDVPVRTLVRFSGD